ncbi:MAG: aldose epimerase family protein [Bacillota bacterium]|nr:aldose epimerase family protein [Bacillota bacterium]
MITEKEFGEGYKLFVIENINGVSVTVTDLGAAVQSIMTPDRNGNFADIVLGYDTPDEYLLHGDYLGATVGRYANRISGAKFSIGNEEYSLTANEGENTLHGGVGFSKKKFSVEYKDEDTLVLELTSPDGEDGFPGKLTANVLYRLNDFNELQIIFSASSTENTVINMCNHSYFNLAGEGSILDHSLMINADKYTPVDEKLIPTGELRPVEGTDFDFRKMRKIEKGFFDHNFVLNEGTLCAELYDEKTGRHMRITTDMPGVQFYAGGMLKERKGKNGAVYGKNSGLCLETQFFPDSPNRPEFPSCLLKKDEVFMKKTVCKFSVK